MYLYVLGLKEITFPQFGHRGAFDRLFLEANHAGTVHMHIEAAPVGSSGARTVWTCADPHCNSRQDGLNLAFAEQGLKRMGFA